MAPECVSRLRRVTVTAFWAPCAFLIGMLFSDLLTFHKQNIILITFGYADFSLPYRLRSLTAPMRYLCAVSCNDILPVIRSAMGG